MTRRAGCHARGAQSAQPADLIERVDDDPADADAERRRELLGGLVVAVAHEALHPSLLPRARPPVPHRWRHRAPSSPRGPASPSLCTRKPSSRRQRRPRSPGQPRGTDCACGPRRRRTPVCLRPPRAVEGRPRLRSGDRQPVMADVSGSRPDGSGPRAATTTRAAATWPRRPRWSLGAGHIASGARTPRRLSAIARPIRTPSTSHNRA